MYQLVSEPVFQPPSNIARSIIQEVVREIMKLGQETAAEDYLKKFEELLPAMCLQESTVIRIFMGGLQPETQDFIQSFDPSSLANSMHLAHLQEKYSQKKVQAETAYQGSECGEEEERMIKNEPEETEDANDMNKEDGIVPKIDGQKAKKRY